MKPSKFASIPQLPRAHYEIDVAWYSIERALMQWVGAGGINLDPDYQRAHVWCLEQQIAFVEYCLAGGEVGRVITWNSPGWPADSDLPIELVDGKQRLEAVRAFIRGEIRPYGLQYEPGDPLSMTACGFKFRVCALATRAEILQLYLNINAGGTPHTQAELDRVRALLQAETSGAS